MFKFFKVCWYLLVMTAANSFAMDPPPPSGPRFDNLFIERSGALIVETEQGFFRSIDEGQNWRMMSASEALEKSGIGMNFPTRGIDIEREVCHPNLWGGGWKCVGIWAPVAAVTSEGVVYRCPGNLGLEVSKDWGKSWGKAAPRSSASPGGDLCLLVAAQGSVVYSLGDHLHRSADNGAHWTFVRQGAIISGQRVLALMINRHGTLFANTSSEGGPGSAIYSSTDGGLQWNRETFGLPEAWQDFGLLRVLPDAVYFIASRDANVSQELIIYRSVDGRTPKRMSVTNKVIVWNDIKVGPDGAIYVVSDSDIYKSIDEGTTWRVLGKKGILFAGNREL